MLGLGGGPTEAGPHASVCFGHSIGSQANGATRNADSIPSRIRTPRPDRLFELMLPTETRDSNEGCLSNGAGCSFVLPIRSWPYRRESTCHIPTMPLRRCLHTCFTCCFSNRIRLRQERKVAF
ncbi:unnamed protein product [Protopolystoma xenopodis]|uniref:Uncharacterized protein n=1 Tax=Protopolystoma xenopodis TaxID=117903 RepID=A0A448XAU3_9PLAT|nr:unnamed protein product [Protopolystoma xenopodis]